MNKKKEGVIIEDSEWMTVYTFERGEIRHASKFLTHDLMVTSKSIRDRWPHFSQNEKYDFVRAYQAKAEVTSEDEEILNFLMKSVVPTIGWVWHSLCQRESVQGPSCQCRSLLCPHLPC